MEPPWPSFSSFVYSNLTFCEASGSHGRAGTALFGAPTGHRPPEYGSIAMFAPSPAGLFLDTKKSQAMFLSPVQHIRPYRWQDSLLSARLSKQMSVIASGANR